MRLELTSVFFLTFTLGGRHKVATDMSCPSLALGQRSFHNYETSEKTQHIASNNIVFYYPYLRFIIYMFRKENE